MKKILVATCLGLIYFLSSGQESQWKLNGELFVYSTHMWRGTGYGDTPSVEPSLTFSKGKFSINFWAAKTFDDTYTEIDIIPSFTFGNYQITIFDYYNPKPGTDNNYFDFEDGESCHSAELAISKNATKRLPVRLLLTSFFFGDKNPETGKAFFSTYAEASVPFSIKNINIEPAVGITPYKGYYADKFSIINTSLTIKRDISITSNMSLPLKLLMVYNPTQEESYLSLGTGISF